MLRDLIPLGLNDKDLATIANRLQVPLIIGDIINGEGALSDGIVYGLHEVLSDDQPDSALLSIALSAYGIAEHCSKTGRSPGLELLMIECQRIISEYGLIWLKNAKSQSLDSNMVFETLVHIPEDLECLSELLDVVRVSMQRNRPEIAQLCSILSTQAGAQGLIAQTFLEGLNMFDEEELWEDFGDMSGEFESDIEAVIADHALKTQTQPFIDNVIQFPVSV